MNDKKYLTVAEYADIVGISKQAVYKQLNNKLKPYLKEVDGKKLIDTEALNLASQPDLNEVKQPFNQHSTTLNQPNQPFFEKQLEEKDKQIASLLKQIDALHEQNGRLTELLNNSQILLAAEKKLLIGKSEEPQPIEQEPEQPKDEEAKPKKKRKSLFKRKRKKD